MIGYPFRFFGYGQVINPMVYDESLSIAQQVAHILGIVEAIRENGVTQSDVNALIAQINDDNAEQTDSIESWAQALVDAVYQYVDGRLDDVAQDNLQWDVTTGAYVTTKEAQRRIFNDVTIHSMTVDELAECGKTVAQVSDSGLNVRGLAVYSCFLDSSTYPDGCKYVDITPFDDTLSVEVLGNGKITEDGYFVTQDHEGDAITTRKLANGKVEDGYMKEEPYGGDTDE